MTDLNVTPTAEDDHEHVQRQYRVRFNIPATIHYVGYVEAKSQEEAEELADELDLDECTETRVDHDDTSREDVTVTVVPERDDDEESDDDEAAPDAFDDEDDED